MVISENGYFIAHPSERTMRQRIDIFQIVESEYNEQAREAAEKATSGESGVIELSNRMTGQSSWFFYEPVPESGWSVAAVLIKDEIPAEARGFRRRIIWICTASIVGLTLLASWLSVNLYLKNRKVAFVWGLAAFATILLAMGVVVIRFVVYNQVGDENRKSVTIVDQAGLDAFLKTSNALTTSRVPAGIFVQSLKFTGADEIFVSGLLWQKISADRQVKAPVSSCLTPFN